MSRSLEELKVDEKRDLVKQIEQKKQGLIDEDWTEICDNFDLSINAETQRKAGVGIKLALDANMLGNTKYGNTQTDLSDGYIDRQKIRDLTRQVNNMYRTESRSEQLRETVRDSIAKLHPIEIRHRGVYGTYDPSAEGKSLVVALGDFHYGAEIHVAGLRGEVINHYDHHVFEERMIRLEEELVQIAKKEQVSDLHIFLVGDLIDGMLRQSQLMRLEYGMVESTIRLSEWLAWWIAQLACETNKQIHIYAATGNHSEIRPLRSKNREFEEENLEKIIVWFLEERLREYDNIEFHGECQKMVLADIQGYSFLLLHGDGEKSISQIAQDAVNMYAEPIDFFICGHKHKEQEIPMGITDDGNSVIIRTPSICGVDRYAQSRGFGGKSGAIAMVIEQEYGRRCVYPIQL